MLDDPLSAVDAGVAKKIYSSIIRGVLREKTVILATHLTQYTKDSDNIIVLKDGRIVESDSKL